jgi:2-polyprenyl-3-methyl-5-hydroxy-6-metoxy-1,4-benzoquinol methylase
VGELKITNILNRFKDYLVNKSDRYRFYKSEYTRLLQEIDNSEIEKYQLTKEKHKLEVEKYQLTKENEDKQIQVESLKDENITLLEELNRSAYSLLKDIRGNSADEGKAATIKYILENVGKNDKILDVGFGSGVYGKLLRAFYYQNIDGLDVYEDNIKELGLDKIYDNIYIKNILDFEFDYYDLIIFGDVLEHIELELAKNLLSRFISEKKCGKIIVSIPYRYEQDEVYGNPYEKHLQPDVTREYMEEHYPYLKLIDEYKIPGKDIIAVYIWEKN